VLLQISRQNIGAGQKGKEKKAIADRIIGCNS
jgi:hypothetical protein